MKSGLDETGEHIAGAMPDAVRSWHIAHGELTILARLNRLGKLMRHLRDDIHCRFVNLTDICGVDWPARRPRFDVVYHLLSPRQNQRVRVKVEVDGATAVPSLCAIFPASSWYERETYDMYGIMFSGHTDLRRLLTDYGFDGFPLRKDFPLSGYVEMRYDDARKKVVYEPLKLIQDYRDFDFRSPWEGPHHALPGDEKAGRDGPSGNA